MSGISVNEKNLVVSIVQFIQQKISSGQLSEDQAESLEVVVQCLGAGFGIEDKDFAFQPSKPLIEIFEAAEGVPMTAPPAEASESEKAEADKLKNIGNDLMREGKFDEAVQKYNEAIKLHKHAVFFCNRAAAYGKMEQHDLAIQDCRTALSLDPKYSKAYGRMGLALSAQDRYQEAADSYKKALELDPTNDSFKNNLEIAEQKSKEREARAGQQNAPPNPFGAQMDIGSILNNPAMMNMASQLMSDPGMQNLMGSLMGSAMTQPGGQQGMGGLLQAGQQLAAQMQNQNPDLVDQLRSAFQGQGSGGQGENNDDSQPENRPRDPPADGGGSSS